MSLFDFIQNKRTEREQKISQYENMGLKVSLEIERRSYQRSINVHVKPSGLVKVTVGKTVPTKKIHQFLKAHRDWILKSQGEFALIRKKYPKKEFLEGELFLLYGRNYPLAFLPSQRRQPKFSIVQEQLLCECDLSAVPTQEEFKKTLQSFYKKTGKALLQQRVEYWGACMRLQPQSLSFRSQKTRWGSCSSKGHISLNWRLVAAPVDVLDYVVIHELAHLRHQNHSQKFWQLVEKYCGKHKQYKRWLREHHFAFDFLARKSELHL